MNFLPYQADISLIYQADTMVVERGGGGGGVDGGGAGDVNGGADGGVDGVALGASAHGVGSMGCPLLEGRPAEDLLPPRGRRVAAAAAGALAGACGDIPDAVWSDTCAAARRSAAQRGGGG